MAKKLSDAPSYAEYTAAKAAYDADPTAANGRAWAIKSAKCKKELGLSYFLPDSMIS
jgi:hypothetical protein